MAASKKSKAARRGPKGFATNAVSTALAEDVWARTQFLVEVLIRVMDREIRSRTPERSEKWRKLFGDKDSAVACLQKLVQLMTDLQSKAPQPEEPVAPIEPEELALLTAWLKETSAGNVSSAGK